MSKFCGNCGVELEDDAKVCGNCGVPCVSTPTSAAKSEVTETVKPTVPTIRTSKTVRVGIVVIAVIAVILIIRGFSDNPKIMSEEEIQMLANNSQNSALVASDGEWIYFNNNGLCKMRSQDGSKQSIVSSEIHPDHMFCINNKLFYYTFPGYYMLNGKAGKDVGFSVFTENCIQSDGSKFYVTGSSNYEDAGVYSCDMRNTKNGTKLSDINPTAILLQGEYLYVISGFDSVNNQPNKNYGTWRMSKNGKDPILVFDYCPDYIVFSGDKMYYTNEYHTVCSANLDGSNETIFYDAKVNGGLNVSKDYIFYVASDTQTIYRIDKKNGNEIALNGDRSSNLNIIGEWLFYENQDHDYKIYKMKFDGSDNQPIY